MRIRLQQIAGFFLGLCFLGGTFPLCAQTDTLCLMSYNLLHFPNGQNSCGSGILIPARWDSLAIITNYTQPDILMVCELQNETGADSILNRALNNNGVTKYKGATFIPNQFGNSTELNNMLFYNSDKLGLKGQNILVTNLRDISKYTLFYKDSALASVGDTIFLEVYVAHLDAGRSDADSRKRQADLLRQAIDTARIAKNVILAGDLNFYTSSEEGYQTLQEGIYPLYDPINRPGNWSGNSGFADIHTQSTRASGTLRMDCGVTGGLDDRFDFILASEPIIQGFRRIQYLPGSYKTLGNNGNSFNGSVNDTANTSAIPQTVKNTLYHTSDHLPVLMNVEVRLDPSQVVDLIQFEGEAFNLLNRLSWKLENVDWQPVGIMLQRSTDGISFQTIEQWSTQQAEIIESYFDPTNEVITYYRLVWTAGNTTQYSPVITIENIQPLNSWRFFPNPAKDQLIIEIPQPLEEVTKIRLYNVLGQEIGDWIFDSPQLQYFLDISQLAAGCYFLRLEQTNFQSVQKFQKG